MTFQPSFSIGNFVPEQIDLPTDIDQLREILKRTLEEHARLLNRKDTGQYEEIEVQNNQTFFSAVPQQKNQIYRKVISAGSLPNAATNSVAHNIANINNNWLFTRIYGVTQEPAGAGNRPFYIPLPNAGPTYQVELMVDNTNVNITTVANLTAFTKTLIVLEFYKG